MCVDQLVIPSCETISADDYIVTTSQTTKCLNNNEIFKTESPRAAENQRIYLHIHFSNECQHYRR